jgi:hypothetical protein
VNAGPFDGPDEFKDLQLSNTTGWKIPPFERCQITQKGQRLTIKTDQEPTLIGSKILKEHEFAFQLQSTRIQAPATTIWWYPYDLNEIMRYGHCLNSSMPESVGEAEFRAEPGANTIHDPN